MTEIGMVVAAVGLLLVNRPAWFLSMVLGVLAGATVTATFVSTHRALTVADATIRHAEEEYKKTNHDESDDESDVKLVEEIRHLPAW
jgi:hypothetical protein